MYTLFLINPAEKKMSYKDMVKNNLEGVENEYSVEMSPCFLC